MKRNSRRDFCVQSLQAAAALGVGSLCPERALGQFNGAVYGRRPGNYWRPLSTTSAPSARVGAMGVWSGTQALFWGGMASGGTQNNGGRFDPVTNTWSSISTTSAPVARVNHAVVWADNQMIVWGGWTNSAVTNTGGRYDPSTNSWQSTSTTSAPTARQGPFVVWTGSLLLVWGGANANNSTYYNTGGRYNPSTNSWTAMTTTGAPAARINGIAPAVVWTGTEMLVWGGFNGNPLNTGGRYNPSSNTWSAITTTGAPEARDGHVMFWTGTRMLVWSGYGLSNIVNTGGLYNPTTNSWTAMSTTGAPAARHRHIAIWNGRRMVVFGGTNTGFTGFYDSGGVYDPETNTWSPMTTQLGATGRFDHAMVWTGYEVIIWSGEISSGLTNTGGIYKPI
jgi:N-acetylneuraminic acid mutarotase